jgi:hypothetical protein
MRHILLDRARRRVAEKRGGHAERVSLDEPPDLGRDRSGELIALEDALNTLVTVDPRKARVVELRFFRRAQRRRNRRRPPGFRGNRDAGLEVRAIWLQDELSGR